MHCTGEDGEDMEHNMQSRAFSAEKAEKRTNEVESIAEHQTAEAAAVNSVKKRKSAAHHQQACRDIDRNGNFSCFFKEKQLCKEPEERAEPAEEKHRHGGKNAYFVKRYQRTGCCSTGYKHGHG